MTPGSQLNETIRRQLRAATEDMNASDIESVRQERGKNVARLTAQLLCPHADILPQLAMASGQRATRFLCSTCNAHTISE